MKKYFVVFIYKSGPNLTTGRGQMFLESEKNKPSFDNITEWENQIKKRLNENKLSNYVEKLINNNHNKGICGVSFLKQLYE